MKVIYATTTKERNFCVDRSRLKGRRVQVCSPDCQSCPHCANNTDVASKIKGIIMCANDASVILTDSQFPPSHVR